MSARTKSVEQSIRDTDEPSTRLRKDLTWWDLTVFGVSVVVGAGIFTVTASTFGNITGPALSISFVIAAVTCGLAALCYAEFASTLPADLLDETVLDQRHAPLVVGDYLAGVSVIQLASDVVPQPNDRVFFDDSTFRTLILISDTGLRHHTTGFKIYEVMFDDVIPAAVVDDQPLRAVVHNACWLGDPVTPLRLFSFSSPSFIVVIP
jgi:hypothetical protein